MLVLVDSGSRTWRVVTGGRQHHRAVSSSLSKLHVASSSAGRCFVASPW